MRVSPRSVIVVAGSFVLNRAHLSVVHPVWYSMEKNSLDYSFSGLCAAIEQGALHVSVHLAAYDGPDISSLVTPFTGHLSPVALPHCADLPFFIRVFSQCDYQSVT